MEQTIKDKLKMGVYLVVAILFGFGGNEYIDAGDLQDIYVCTSNERLYTCPGNPLHIAPLSDTAKSCYYVNDLGESKYKRCMNGVFMPITDYAEAMGVDPMDLVKGTMIAPEYISKSSYGAGVKQYHCSYDGCLPVNN